MIPAHPLEALSIEAVRYGQDLGPLDIPDLAARLYRYNAQPASTPVLASLMALDQAAATGALGTVVASKRDSSTGLVVASLDSDWARWAPASIINLDADAGADGFGGEETREPSTALYKLYISPAVPELRDALQVLGEVLPRVEALAFKRARGTALLRPDKVVLHFASWEQLAEAAHILHQALRGIVPQGVPFTAPLFDDMLISWGADPPADAPGLHAAESWRSWVTTRVAEELAATMCDGESGAEPWKDALCRLARYDIDVPAFSPGESMTGPRLATI